MDAGTCGRVVDGGTGADADGGCACSGMGDDTMLACRMRAMRVVMSSESLESSSEEEARRACFPVERESPRRGMLRLEACCCAGVDGALGAVATTGMTAGGGGGSGDEAMCWWMSAFGVKGAGTGAAGCSCAGGWTGEKEPDEAGDGKSGSLDQESDAGAAA